MALSLTEVQAYFEDESNWLELGKVLSLARRSYVEAGDVSGIAYEYMKESLLYWLEYHADQYDELSDIDADDVEAVNAADLEQQQGILIWAWDQSFTLENIGYGDNLDTVVDQAAEALEIAAVRALLALSVWTEDDIDDEN